MIIFYWIWKNAKIWDSKLNPKITTHGWNHEKIIPGNRMKSTMCKYSNPELFHKLHFRGAKLCAACETNSCHGDRERSIIIHWARAAPVLLKQICILISTGSRLVKYRPVRRKTFVGRVNLNCTSSLNDQIH